MCSETLKMLVKMFRGNQLDSDIQAKYKARELCNIYRKLLNAEPSTTLKNSKTKLIADMRKYIMNMQDSYNIRLANTSILEILTIEKYENAEVFIENIDELIANEIHNKEYATLETSDLVKIAVNIGCIEKEVEMSRADVIRAIEEWNK